MSLIASLIIFQHLYPKTQIDVFITVLENDGSVVAAALTCASLALANASVQMFDLTIGASIVSLIIRNESLHTLLSDFFWTFDILLQ